MGDYGNSLCASDDKNRYWCNRGLDTWEKCTCEEFVANHVNGPRRHMVVSFENETGTALLQYHRVTSNAEMSREVKVSIGLTQGSKSKEDLRTGRSHYQMGGQAEAKLEWLPLSFGRAGRIGASLLSNSVDFYNSGERHHGYMLRPGVTWEFPLTTGFMNFGWTLDLGAHGGVPLNVPDDRAVYSVDGGLNLYFFKYPNFQPIFSLRTQYLTRDNFDDENNWVSSFHVGIGF